MPKNVLDLAEEDTYLNKASSIEVCGPCPNPKCGRKTNGFRVRQFYDEAKDKYVWKFMCRGCYDAAEWIPGKERKRGWGDEIDYVRHFRGIKGFTAAKNYLAGQVDSTLDRVRSLQKNVTVRPGEIPGDYWQKKYNPFVSAAADRLLRTPEGREGLDYLLSRGLNKDTIEAAHLGYAKRNRRPCIVIPWYDQREKGYWRVSLRDITPGIPKEERYKNTLPGFSGDGIYLGDSLLRKLPTFLVEGEFDALSIMQAASDLVNVVATGSTGNAQVPKWEMRLARMPSVLVAFDREDKGDQAAQYWLDVLDGVTTVLRYRPLTHDVNDMLIQGYDVRSWVVAALDYLSDQDQDAGSQSVQAAPLTQNTLATPEPQNSIADTCSVCGTDLTDNDRACYNPDGVAFCDYDQDGAAFCSRGRVRTPIESYEQFIGIAHGLALVPGPDCKITPIEPGYTLEKHVAMLEQQQPAERQGKRAGSKHARIPDWLVPGSSEWQAHVDFLHLGPRLLRNDFPGITGQCATRKDAIHEMRERRAAWFQQKSDN